MSVASTRNSYQFCKWSDELMIFFFNWVNCLLGNWHIGTYTGSLKKVYWHPTIIHEIIGDTVVHSSPSSKWLALELMSTRWGSRYRRLTPPKLLRVTIWYFWALLDTISLQLTGPPRARVRPWTWVYSSCTGWRTVPGVPGSTPWLMTDQRCLLSKTLDITLASCGFVRNIPSCDNHNVSQQNHDEMCGWNNLFPWHR